MPAYITFGQTRFYSVHEFALEIADVIAGAPDICVFLSIREGFSVAVLLMSKLILHTLACVQGLNEVIKSTSRWRPNGGGGFN